MRYAARELVHGLPLLQLPERLLRFGELRLLAQPVRDVGHELIDADLLPGVVPKRPEVDLVVGSGSARIAEFLDKGDGLAVHPALTLSGPAPGAPATRRAGRACCPRLSAAPRKRAQARRLWAGAGKTAFRSFPKLAPSLELRPEDAP